MYITKREFISTSFFLGRAMFLGVGFSYIFRFSGKDSWISLCLGYLIGNIFIFIYHKISENISYNLNNFLNKKSIVSYIYKFLFFIIYFYLLLYVGIIFTNFVKVYYLFETPIYVTLGLLFILSYYASLKSENTILRVCVLLLPISLIINLLNAGLLVNFVEISNFMPIYTTEMSNIFIGSLIFAIFSSVPNILLMEYKVSLKTKMFSYLLVFVVISLINFCIMGVLGEYLTLVYSYPEYMVLKKIKLLNFIENVENFASIIWYFDAFILINLSLSKIRKMFHSKKKNIFIPLLLMITVIVSYLIFSKYFVSVVNFFGLGIIILGILLIITGPLLLIATKKRKIS